MFFLWNFSSTLALPDINGMRQSDIWTTQRHQREDSIKYMWNLLTSGLFSFLVIPQHTECLGQGLDMSHSYNQHWNWIPNPLCWMGNPTCIPVLQKCCWSLCTTAGTPVMPLNPRVFPCEVSSFYSWGNWCPEGWSALPGVTSAGRGGPGILVQVMGSIWALTPHGFLGIDVLSIPSTPFALHVGHPSLPSLLILPGDSLNMRVHVKH